MLAPGAPSETCKVSDSLRHSRCSQTRERLAVRQAAFVVLQLMWNACSGQSRLYREYPSTTKAYLESDSGVLCNQSIVACNELKINQGGGVSGSQWLHHRERVDLLR